MPVDATEEMKDARQAIEIRMDRGACSMHCVAPMRLADRPAPNVGDKLAEICLGCRVGNCGSVLSRLISTGLSCANKGCEYAFRTSHFRSLLRSWSVPEIPSAGRS